MAGHCGEQERLSGAGAGGRLLQARVLQARVLQAQAHLRLRVALEVGDAAALDKDVPTAARRAGAGGGSRLGLPADVVHLQLQTARRAHHLEQAL